MPLDLDTLLTTLYTAVGDLYKERLPHPARRPGAKPELSDSEVLALSVCAEWGRRDHNGLLLAGPADGWAASAGWCAAKREYYYGFRLVLSISLSGVIPRYELVPAHTHDLEAAAEVLEPRRRYWADKGFPSRLHEHEWRESEGAEVVAEPDKSSRARRPKEYSCLVHRVRQVAGVVNAQLEEQFRIGRSRAKTVRGLDTRVQAKLTAHTFGVYLNALSGRPALALKDLVARTNTHHSFWTVSAACARLSPIVGRVVVGGDQSDGARESAQAEAASGDREARGHRQR